MLKEGGDMAEVLSDYHWASYGFGLSARIRRLRHMRGLSQTRLAELSGLSRSVISNLERNYYSGERSADPTLSTLYKIAFGLHVPPAVLLPAVDQIVEEICPTEFCDGTVPAMAVEWPTRPEDTARFHDDYIYEGKLGQAPRFCQEQPG
ncbi:helix-turn-helix transcriptional regulator [Corynebacterium breve]|uniref:Helix-turn-helix transcriptional regulator n=1 Tax=Corynebacterium breve TaxID=3049799 RepID=A0ABY8VGW9_9CORY|nr:helix-turn-helix transcriptional regulator [Corynebacterium breve]WIM68211.1 helix-turn-helix transcriptional regulator [Corynebacterium breve]